MSNYNAQPCHVFHAVAEDKNSEDSRARGRYLSLALSDTVIAAVIGLVRSLKHLVIECALSHRDKRTIRSTNLRPLDRLHFSNALRNQRKFR